MRIALVSALVTPIGTFNCELRIMVQRKKSKVSWSTESVIKRARRKSPASQVTAAQFAKFLQNLIYQSSDAEVRRIARAYLDGIEAGRRSFSPKSGARSLLKRRVGWAVANSAAKSGDWKTAIRGAEIALGPLPGKSPHDSPSKPSPRRRRTKQHSSSRSNNNPGVSISRPSLKK